MFGSRLIGSSHIHAQAEEVEAEREEKEKTTRMNVKVWGWVSFGAVLMVAYTSPLRETTTINLLTSGRDIPCFPGNRRVPNSNVVVLVHPDVLLITLTPPACRTVLWRDLKGGG
ncbi:hypothetical protein QE152_g14076 [Popillia japonica]|uniref:Uncharacterized protein n=1 Tax=Popillia japonica TaxID=7064 RepID=A0AAW1LAF3_POPJA